jgi:hypothetical protein
MIALQVQRNARLGSGIEDNESSDSVQTRFVVDSLSDNATLDSGSKPRTLNFSSVVAAVPAWTSNNEYFLRFFRLAFTPCRPAFVRSPGIRIQVELVEQHFDSSSAQPLTKCPDLHPMGFAFVSVTEKDRCHSSWRLSECNNSKIPPSFQSRPKTRSDQRERALQQ